MRSSSRPGVLAASALRGQPTSWPLDDISALAWARVSEQAQPESQTDQTERLRLEVERRVEDAHSAGYAAGRLDGELAEATRLRDAIASAETALDAIRASEAKWQDCVVENITALAVTVARHIVGRELHSDATGVADLVKRALAEFPIDQPMRVRVNPLDLSLLSLPNASDGAPVTIAPNRDVRWLADSRIHPGGCVVEGRERIVDGRIDTALERLYRKLTNNNA
ncbi:MAG: FliH/SctL family protein [Gemmatimonadota bacterium]|nr:FliH/SctL family protein [Gemmatimonadota bacterium]